MHQLQRTRPRVLQHHVFQFLGAFADVLEDGEIAVDDGVEQGIGEIVGAEPADLAAILAQAFAHRVEAAAGRSWKLRTKLGPRIRLTWSEPISRLSPSTSKKRATMNR